MKNNTLNYRFLGGLSLAAALLLAAGGMQAAHAAKTVLATFNAAKWGEIGPDGRGTLSGTKIRKVVHYEYTFGGHDQANQRNSLARLAAQYGFALERWTTQSDVTASNLLGVDIVVINQGDGDVFDPAGSSYVTAIKNHIEVTGKGLLAMHAAGAYVPCPTSGTENLTDAGCRWLARVLVRQYLAHDADLVRARIYADSVLFGQVPPGATGTGAVAAARNHGRKNITTQNIFENLPWNGGTATTNKPYVWDGVGDEWYNYRGYVRLQGAQTFDGVAFGPVIVLISMDESGYTSSYKMGDRSESWTRTVGNGLTAYNNMGHSNVWTRARTGNALGATSINDSMPEKYNWRLMKYLGRDFMGCTQPGFLEYNPEATIATLTASDDASPCKTPTQTAIRFEKGRHLLTGMTVAAGILRVPTSEAGAYTVSVTNAAGRQVFFRATVGGANRKVEVNGLNKGAYMVRVTTPNKSEAVAKVILN